ncbi:MFS transporter [Pseudochelatococcus sp. B33]
MVGPGSGRRAVERSARFQYAAAALVLFLTLLGSHLATPLYPLWKESFSLSTAQITVIYACYPIGVIGGLLLGGRLGDQIGRRPLTLVGILLTTCSTIVYLTATGMAHLVSARLLNGIAIGLMSGPAMAAIVELHPTGDRSEASRIGAITTLASPAAGLLLATIVIQFATVQHATTLPFQIQLGGLVVALLLLCTYRETILPENRRPFGRASFGPRKVSMSRDIRAGLAFASTTGAVDWANAGLWLALGPVMVVEVMGASSQFLGGLAVVAFLSMAGMVQLAARGMPCRRAITLGLALIPPSLALICGTLVWESAFGLVASAILAGVAQGLCWLGSSELVNRITPGAIRASVLSGLFIAGYFGAAIPVIATGFAADRLGLVPAILMLGVALSLLAGILLLYNRRFARGAVR